MRKRIVFWPILLPFLFFLAFLASPKEVFAACTGSAARQCCPATEYYRDYKCADGTLCTPSGDPCGDYSDCSRRGSAYCHGGDYWHYCEGSSGSCSVAGCGSNVQIDTNNINDCDWVTPTSTPAPTNTPFPTPTPCVDQSPSAPGLSAPANGTVTNVSPQTLSWTAPFSWGFECDGGYWNRYRVYSCTGAGCHPGNVLQDWTTNTSYSWGGLVSGTVYGWRVEATNGNKTTSSVIWYFTYDNEAPQCSSFTDSPDPLTMGQTLSTTPTFTDNVSVYQIEMYVIRPPTMRLKIIVS